MAEPPKPLNIDDSYKSDEKSSLPSIPSRLNISESTLEVSTSDLHLECRQQIIPKHLIGSDYERGQVLKDYEQRMHIMESSSPRIGKREDLLKNKQPFKFGIMAEPPELLNIDDSSDEESFLRHLMRMLTCLKTSQVSTSDPRHLESLLEKVIVLNSERHPSNSDTVIELSKPLNLADSTKSEEKSSLQHSIKMPTSLETPQAFTSDFSAFLPQITLIIQHMESLKKYVSELNLKKITLIIQDMESLKKCVAELDHERSDIVEKQPEALNDDDSFKSDQELSFKGPDTQTQRQADKNLESSCSDSDCSEHNWPKNEIVNIRTSNSASRTPSQCSQLSWNYTTENKELEKIKNSKEHIYNTTSSQFAETDKDIARVISTKQDNSPKFDENSSFRPKCFMIWRRFLEYPFPDPQHLESLQQNIRSHIIESDYKRSADDQVKNIQIEKSTEDSTIYSRNSIAISSASMPLDVQTKATEEEEEFMDPTVSAE